MSNALLEVRDLVKHFPVTRGLVLQRQVGQVKAVDGVSFAVPRGATFGLVGESGCGKTTVSNLILGLERSTRGQVLFAGQEVSRWHGADLRRYQSMVQPVFQDPYSSLNPRLRVWESVAEPLLVHRRLSRPALKAAAGELLEMVGLHVRHLELYPHEFSGGQRQRIAIARALSLRPKLIVLDEPISALDVSIRAQIVNLLRRLQRELGLTYLLIAHDLAVVQLMSDQVGVMYLGKLVEVTDSERLYARPLHPYTQALLSAVPPAHPDEIRSEILLAGEVPSPLDVPTGCRFHTRCPHAQAVCRQVEPSLSEVEPGHRTACHLTLQMGGHPGGSPSAEAAAVGRGPPVIGHENA